jgi:hypothetical protein
MDQPFYLREQAERYRRLARESTDPSLRNSLLSLAEEYAARADARETDDMAVWQPTADDHGND